MQIDKDLIPTKFLWVDLEMSGLDPNRDVILEVAAEVTDVQLQTIATYEAVIHHNESILTAMNPWAQHQHDTSGLTERCRQSDKDEQFVVQEFVNFIRLQFGSEPAILAGNSIHNDRAFIKQWWPTVDERLHYRMLDVSSWKIIMQSQLNVQFEKQETHRAFDDVQASIAELQFYLSWFKHQS